MSLAKMVRSGSSITSGSLTFKPEVTVAGQPDVSVAEKIVFQPVPSGKPSGIVTSYITPDVKTLPPDWLSTRFLS